MTKIEMQTDTEVRTRSVPTAAALICAGFEPIRAIHRDHGGALLVFAPAARTPLDAFYNAKQRVDAMLADAENRR
jgi:hypothetical protein